MKITSRSLQHKRRSGTVMVMAILLSVVLTGIVMCLALAATVQTSTSAALVKTDGTFYAAEYAMQDTLWRFKTDNTYRAPASSPRNFNLSLNGNTYNCSVSCEDDIGYPTIEWKFNEGSGSTTADSSVNGNTGTLFNTTWTNDAREGPYALLFDGATSYVNCGSSSSTNFAGNVTMSAWIKLTNASFDQKIGGNQNGLNGGYKFYIYNSKVIFEVRASDNTSTRNKNQPGGTVLAVNTWYHVVGLYSETNHWIKTFVNGQEELPRRMTGLPSNALATTSPNFVIGREPYSNLYYFGGAMDDIRVYNSEMSDAAIKAMYDSAVQVHATVTLAGSKNKATAGVSASCPLPPPPTLPEFVAGKDLDLNNVTVTGDLLVSGSLTGSGLPSTVDGNMTYANTYTPAGKITQLNNPPNTLAKSPVTVPIIDYAMINAQAKQTFASSQNGTTFKFTDLTGNKVIRVNGDVTDPKFDLVSGVFPSGGTLMINGNLKFTTPTTIGNATNGVYIVVTGDCTQNAAAIVNFYGGLYVQGKWNRVGASVNGPVVIKDMITDSSLGLTNSSFTPGSVPWFDPRVILYNGQAALPMVFSDYHDDNN